MSQSSTAPYLLIFSSLCLAACSSEQAELGQARTVLKHCTVFSGDAPVAAVLSDTCAGCLVESPEKAVDGDFETYATLVVPAAVQGQAAIRASAQAGIVFAADSQAAVIAEVRKTSSASLMATGSVASLLAGQPQEHYEFDSAGVLEFNGIGGFSAQAIRLPATRAFDALEIGFDGTFSGYTVQVHEFCSDSF